MAMDELRSADDNKDDWPRRWVTAACSCQWGGEDAASSMRKMVQDDEPEKDSRQYILDQVLYARSRIVHFTRAASATFVGDETEEIAMKGRGTRAWSLKHRIRFHREV
ncbi:hypothetical protein AKJ16_DCAP17370 [Drosera capensis]